MDKDNQWFAHACEMWAYNAEALKHMPDMIDQKSYENAFRTIHQCKGRIATLGMGTSSVAARKIAHMLCVANVPAFFISAGDAAHGAFGSVQAGDVVIVLSKGGDTEELVNLIEPIKKKKLVLITVTQNPDSRLAKAADVLLLFQSGESDHLHRLPTTSILVIISIFDAIADELTQHSQFNDEVFYLNHTHGSVGSDLKKEIEKKE